MTRFGLVLFSVGLGLAPPELVAYTPEKAFRRPVALAWTKDGLLAVANRDTGSVSLLDVKDRKVVSEFTVGKKLSSLCSLHDGRFLVATDEEKSELLLLEAKGAMLKIRDRLAVPVSPVNVVAPKSGSFVVVASLWARRVSLIRVNLAVGELSRIQIADLPFPPRLQWIDPQGQRLILADAFSNKVAALSLPDLRLVSTRVLPGHNVGGMTLAPNGIDLLFSHQALNPFVPTIRPRVFWGSVMQNGLTGLAIQDFFDPSKPMNAPFARRKHYPVGQNGKGAGEPGPMLFTKKGLVVLGIRGTGEVAVGESLSSEWVRIPVGKRPVACVLDPKERFAYFVDLFADTVPVIDLEKNALAASISLGDTPEPGLLQRGEELFHNSHLSLDGWYSCNSCHTSCCALHAPTLDIQTSVHP